MVNFYTYASNLYNYYTYNSLLSSNPINWANLYTQNFLTKLFSNYINTITQMPTFDQYRSAADVNQMARIMEEAAQNFINANVFSSLTAITPEGVQAEVNSNVEIGNYTFQVSQLAQEQINQGNQMNANTLDFNTGLQSFRITIGNNQYTFNINVLNSDTNETVLQKIAQSINEAGIGINATVENNNGQVQLTLRGENTGTNYAFTIEDITGNLVSTANLNNTIQNAQNTVYTYNNITYQSQSRTFELVPGLNITAENTGEFTVEVTYDTNNIRENVENLINNINNFLETLRNNLPNLGTNYEVFANLLENYAEQLEDFGIIYNNGRFEITEEFEQALQNPYTLKYRMEPTFNRLAQSAMNVGTMVQSMSTTFAYGNNLNNLWWYNFLNGYMFSYFPSVWNTFA